MNVDELTIDELRELQAVIKTKLKRQARGYIERRMVTKTLSDGTTRTYGPYFYLKVWKNGRLTSRYLGKQADHA